MPSGRLQLVCHKLPHALDRYAPDRIAAAAEGRPVGFEEVERFAFYERAKGAMAIVATGESALYGNIILKKGVLGPE